MAWTRHAARKPHAVVMVKQLLCAPGQTRSMGCPHLTWGDTAMHGMGSLGRTLQIDLPRVRMCGGGLIGLEA